MGLKMTQKDAEDGILAEKGRRKCLLKSERKQDLFYACHHHEVWGFFFIKFKL